jgi:anti-sigma B factor antagonist
MDANLTEYEGIPVLTVSGRVDHQVSHRLREQIERAIVTNDHRLILDISRVPTMDSGGIGAVVAAFVAIKKSGGKLVLAGPSKNVRHVLRTTRLDTVIEVFPNVEHALSGV